MARYPTLDQYKGEPQKGIQRCDEFLKKSPNDVQLLTTKLQLLASIHDSENGSKVLDQLLAIQPPIRDLSELSSIEVAIDDMHSTIFPQPPSAGPEVSKLWDNASKSSANTNYKLDLHSLRFSRAIMYNRLVDAQQSLIQLKALQPKNRSFYMAHAAVTQLISTSKEDLQSRLALSLARKAVSEKFDKDKELDCRVPGQIFAVQGSEKDLEGISGRPFAESKQVYEAKRSAKETAESGDNEKPATSPDPATLQPREWLLTEIEQLKKQFRTLVSSDANVEALNAFAADAIRLHTTAFEKQLGQFRPIVNTIFLAISALVKVWTINGNVSSLMWSAFLAENVLKSSPNVHEAKVILAYLYMRLDLPSLAMRYWDSLSIKEIQYDTFGHAFLTRLSITHPQAFKGMKLRSSDPMSILKYGLNVYARHEEKLAEAEASVLMNGQTGMIFDLHELREHLRSSLTRRILSLEQRRYARLFRFVLDDTAVHVLPRATANWITTKDNRDFQAAFDFGFRVERALHEQDDGKHWILSNLAADTVWCLALKQVPAILDHEELLKQLDEIDLGSLSISASPTSITAAETLFGNLAHSLLKASAKTRSAAPLTSEDLRPIEQALRKLDIDSLMASAEPLSSSLKTVYLYADILRVTTAFCKHVPSKLTELASIQISCDDAFAKLKKFAKSNETALQAPNISEMMTGDEGLAEMVKGMDKEELRSFCAAVAESTKEAWSGFAKMKLT